MAMSQSSFELKNNNYLTLKKAYNIKDSTYYYTMGIIKNVLIYFYCLACEHTSLPSNILQFNFPMFYFESVILNSYIQFTIYCMNLLFSKISSYLCRKPAPTSDSGSFDTLSKNEISFHHKVKASAIELNQYVVIATILIYLYFRLQSEMLLKLLEFLKEKISSLSLRLEHS